MTLIGNLERELVFGDNEMSFDRLKSYLGLRAKQNEGKEVDLESSSRREFMVGAGKTVVAGGMVATGLASLMPGEAEAGRRSMYDIDFDKLPPGILNCRDKILKLIYGVVNDLWKIRAEFILKDEMKHGVKRETKYIEPAFYLVNEMGQFHLDGTYKDLKEKNPALYYFQNAIDNYFDLWVRKNVHSLNKNKMKAVIERDLLFSLYSAAYESQDQAIDLAIKFDITDMGTKASMAQDLMQRFQNMKGSNKNSADPNNAYNRRLVGMWSTYFLVQHYDIQNNKQMGDLIHNYIEKKTRNLLGHPIRGPPHYNV